MSAAPMSEPVRVLSADTAPTDLVGAVNQTLEYRITACDKGVVEVLWTPPARLANPAGMVHGGYVSMIVDDCCGMSINSLMPRMVALPTVTLKVDFLRGVRVGGNYRVTGSVTRIGRQVSFADAEIRTLPEHESDDRGTLLARGEGVFTADLSGTDLVGFTTR